MIQSMPFECYFQNMTRHGFKEPGPKDLSLLTSWKEGKGARPTLNSDK